MILIGILIFLLFALSMILITWATFLFTRAVILFFYHLLFSSEESLDNAYRRSFPDWKKFEKDLDDLLNL